MSSWIWCRAYNKDVSLADPKGVVRVVTMALGMGVGVRLTTLWRTSIFGEESQPSFGNPRRSD